MLQALVHQRLAEQTLLTLNGFLGWIKFEVLFAQDCILLQILCLLLDNDVLKIPACECLLIIINRKVGSQLTFPSMVYNQKKPHKGTHILAQIGVLVKGSV